jgi:hypothetical protein
LLLYYLYGIFYAERVVSALMDNLMGEHIGTG